MKTAYLPRALSALASVAITLSLLQGVARLAEPSPAHTVQMARLTLGGPLR
jgi:hypothetical protein